jgi:hypothetical protein
MPEFSFSCTATFGIHIVAYLLKARTVEPEKQPLLANGTETSHKTNNRTSIARQQILNKQ